MSLWKEINNKFKPVFLIAFKIAGYMKNNSLENIRQGECDWCNKPAVSGFKVNDDAFYVCEKHKEI